MLLDDAIDVLSDRDREVLRLRFAEDLTQTEISKRIGVSQMQVSRIIRQALRALRVGHRPQVASESTPLRPRPAPRRARRCRSR